MLRKKRKQLIFSIIIEIMIAVIFILASIFFWWFKISVKLDEIQIYNSIVKEYPNLTYDKKLSKIAEDCAEKCLTEKLQADDIKILENKEFVELYSSDTYVTKYTDYADTDEIFINNFLSIIQTEEYSDTDSYLKQCDYIGIGKYENQVFMIAFYNSY